MIFHSFELHLSVKNEELKKFGLMSSLIFCILFNQNLIYSLKESLIVTTLGAEAANFIEGWVIFPAILISSIGYLKLSSIIPDKAKLFYLICTFFLVFFFAFAFFLYPNIEKIVPGQHLIDIWTEKLPHLKWFIIVFSDWPLLLFNIFSELWVNIMLLLLFWQYANNIMPTSQAKRFYPLFGIIGNMSLIVSSMVIKQICINNVTAKIVKDTNIFIILVGLCCMLIFKLLYTISEKGNVNFNCSDKKSLSFRESLKLIYGSKYLWLLSTITVSYGVIISLSQGLWKAEVIKMYPSAETYLLFITGYQKWLGITSIITIFITSILIRKAPWILSAIIAPIIIFVTGFSFFFLVSYSKFITRHLSESLYLISSVWMGTIHMILTRSIKRSLVDNIKELAYLPLESNLKDKGKVAVDLIGERLGRSGGFFLQSILFTLIPSAGYRQFAPLFLVILTSMLASWFIAVKLINKEYLILIKESKNK
jgi:AAA family ATP:ADP antiporter